MSLINEALKKAQKERGAEVPPLSAMPTVGGEPASRIARRGKATGFPLSLGLGLGAVALAVVGIGGVLLLRKPADEKPAVPAVATAAPASQPAPVAAQPVVVPAATPAVTTPSPAPAIVVPVVTAPPPATTPAPAPITPAKIELPIAVAETPKPVPPPAQTAPAAAAPVVAVQTQTPAPAIIVPVVTTTPAPVLPSPEPARPGKLEPRAINFIESLRVAGIRASATDAKVLMNDRVYRLGTIVEHEMGLKLTAITANSLTFEDERGGSYTRTF